MGPLAPPLRRLRPVHWIAIDAVFTALMLLVYIELKAAPFMQGIPRWAAIAIVLIAVLPAAVRRRWPRSVLALAVIAGAVTTALSFSPAPPLSAAFAMYMIPLRLSRREALWMLAGTLLVMTAGLAVFAVTTHGPYGTGTLGKGAGLLLEGGLLVTVGWLIGYLVRQQRRQAADRREQAERRAREQRAEARRARSEERLQISRELHDVMAHTMSLIAVQAGVASYVIGTQPEEAARALVSIEETSRSALHEMRALLRMLRDWEDRGTGQAANATGQGRPGPALAPAPGLADLGSLVRRTGEAGVRVELSVRGERPWLPAGLDLAAYRIIQEAVTNVIKHAATDRCEVSVGYQEDTLTLQVTDNGSGSAAAGDGSDAPANGNGIIGMRERAGIYGGQVRAARLPGRGFQVTARFPLAGMEPADTRA